MRNDGTVSYFQDTYLSPLLQNQKCLEEEENNQSNFEMEKLDESWKYIELWRRYQDSLQNYIASTLKSK